MRKIMYYALVLLLILITVSCNVSGKGDERYVVFNSTGGTGTMPDQLFLLGVAQNLSSNVFVKDGYRFKNWNTSENMDGTSYENGAVYTFESEGQKTLTLYANWVPADTYTVRFVEVLSKFRFDQEIKVGVSTPLLGVDEIGIKDLHPGYELLTNCEWNSRSDGMGYSYKDKQNVINLGEAGSTVYLYAQWRGQVKYDKNGGECVQEGVDVPATDIILGESVKLATNTNSNTGNDYYRYNGGIFTGWTTLPNNQIDGKLYSAGETITKGFTDNTTLYANWKFLYTSFTVDKETVIRNRQQLTVDDPDLLKNSNYIIVASGHLFPTEHLSATDEPLTEKIGIGPYPYVIKDYKIQQLKDKGKGETYYKDTPSVKVIVIYTIPSGPWEKSLPSKKFLQRLGNSTGSRDDKIDQRLFVELSQDPTAKSWSGSEYNSEKGWMLQLSQTEFNWAEQTKTEYATKYQTALF